MKELSIDVKNILGLQLPSDPRWVNLAELQLDEILTDHAYCEQKAATTCISLITKNSEAACKLFADDIKLYSFVDCNGVSDGLNTSLNNLVLWSQTWQLNININ